jgi:hypothetical protein
MSSATGEHDHGAHHVVQFFDTLESRAAAVARFLQSRALRGDRLLVVVKPEHWVNIRRELDVSGFATAAAETNGRLIVRDVSALLRSMIRHGDPDAAAFESSIGALVRTLSSGHPLSIYGEMVDVLGERGELDAAVALESLWNALASQVPFTLMCGYASAHFVSAPAGARLRQVCEAHGRVRTRPDDPLGRWLLDAANVPFQDDASGTLA